MKWKLKFKNLYQYFRPHNRPFSNEEMFAIQQFIFINLN